MNKEKKTLNFQNSNKIRLLDRNDGEGKKFSRKIFLRDYNKKISLVFAVLQFPGTFTLKLFHNNVSSEHC